MLSWFWIIRCLWLVLKVVLKSTKRIQADSPDESRCQRRRCNRQIKAELDPAVE